MTIIENREQGVGNRYKVRIHSFGLKAEVSLLTEKESRCLGTLPDQKELGQEASQSEGSPKHDDVRES